MKFFAANYKYSNVQLLRFLINHFFALTTQIRLGTPTIRFPSLAWETD